MQVTIVLGTARKGRQSEKVGKLLEKSFISAGDTTVELVDVRDHVTLPETIPNWGEGGANEKSTVWKDIVSRTDSFIFILPEYNHGYPGEWKILVDSLYNEYKGKKAYIVGVSSGMFSGVRVADHVKAVLVELNMDVQKTALQVGKVKDLIDEEGNTEDEAFMERVTKFVDAVVTNA